MFSSPTEALDFLQRPAFVSSGVRFCSAAADHFRPLALSASMTCESRVNQEVKGSFKVHVFRPIFLVGGLEHLDYSPIYWEFHHPN